MRIQQKEKKFSPVTITLESKEEVEILLSVLGRLEGDGNGKIRKLTDSIFNKLCDLGFYVSFDNLIKKEMELLKK